MTITRAHSTIDRSTMEEVVFTPSGIAANTG